MTNTSARTMVITGATSGIGRAAALAFAERGVRLVLVGRDEQRLAAVHARAAEVSGNDVHALRADFASLDQVRELAVRIRALCPRIDVLANNAGSYFSGRTSTVDGFEATIQTNHLAGFLLTTALRDRLSGGRIVLTASDSYRNGRIDPADINGTAVRYSGLGRYGASKQANVLFAREAARRWPDVLSASFHPGTVRTDFGSGTLIAPLLRLDPFRRTPERGADTLGWLAETPDAQLTSGGYYTSRALRKVTGKNADPVLAARLWEASTAAVS